MAVRNACECKRRIWNYENICIKLASQMHMQRSSQIIFFTMDTFHMKKWREFSPDLL